MNSLEAEYSFLAPTWKLPSVVTPSIYSRSYGTSYLSSVPNVGPDWSLWNNTVYNSGYIPAYTPSTTLYRNYPVATNYPRSRPVNAFQRQNYPTTGGRTALSDPNNLHPGAHNAEDGLNLTISLHPQNDFDSYSEMPLHNQSNHSMTNRGPLNPTNNTQSNYVPPNQKRRVQIVDHNRQTPSTVINDNMSGILSRNSNNIPSYNNFNRTPDPRQSQQKSTYASNHNRDHLDDNRSRSNANNQNIHEYLYGLSVPDPGSYTETFKQHQRRLQEEKVGRKSVLSEYKSFAKNGGFGPSFGNAEHNTIGERAENEKKRKSYAKVVHETNHYKIEEQKRLQANAQPKNRPQPVPKYQRAREYADTIEKPHHTKPVVRLRDPYSGNVIIRDAPHQHRERIYS